MAAIATSPPPLGLDEDPPAPLKLVSKDGKEFEVERDYAFISKLLRTSCESDSSATKIPLNHVAGNILELVVEYFNHHKGRIASVPEKPLKSKNMIDVCQDAWDAKFIDRVAEKRPLLYDLILAANFLDIPPLLHLGCAKVAAMIKAQPLDRIREVLKPAPK